MDRGRAECWSFDQGNTTLDIASPEGKATVLHQFELLGGLQIRQLRGEEDSGNFSTAPFKPDSGVGYPSHAGNVRTENGQHVGLVYGALQRHVRRKVCNKVFEWEK